MVDVSQSEGPADDSAARPSRGWIDGVLSGIFALRVPLVLGAITVAALTIPDQVREIHRIHTQERTWWSFFDWHWILCLMSLVALSLVLWQTSRLHAEDYLEDIGDIGGTPTAVRRVLAWGPRLIAMLPLVGAAAGIWLSSSTTASLDDIMAKDIPETLKPILKQQEAMSGEFLKGAAVCLVLAVIVFVLATLFERKLAPIGSRRVKRVAVLNNWLLFPLLILLSVGLLIYNPIGLPEALGSIPIFALWMANLAVLFALFWRYSRVIGFPVIIIILALLIAFETSGRTDNHKFRITSTREVDRPSVEDAFRTWLASRADLDAYRSADKPYPIYIVATEGGGLYAAYQTAKLLGRMQDLCANFAQHVFAISAVSGGSLGSAIFAGLTKENAKNIPAQPCVTSSEAKAGTFEAMADRMLSRDLLSPVVWATLFPDFLQRFIPYPFPKLDRGYTLELAFEQTWRRRGGSTTNYIQSPFFENCGPQGADCTKGATPMLAFNVTNVETGMQMVLSQMELNTWPHDGPPQPFDVFSNSAEPVDISVSTAVGLSARFPWISPQGWYTFPDPAQALEFGKDKAKPRRMSFVDGGYVDNSGVATATKIARLLSHWTTTDKTLPRVDIQLIVISAAWIPFDRFWIEPPQNRSMSEYVSPFVAALAAWQGRGYTAQREVAADRQFNVIDMGVYYNFMPLPVGWQLSRLSRSYIDEFKGFPDKCDPEKAKLSNLNHATMAGSYIYRANCAAAKVVNDLTTK